MDRHAFSCRTYPNNEKEISPGKNARLWGAGDRSKERGIVLFFWGIREGGIENEEGSRGVGLKTMSCFQEIKG